MKRTVLFTLCIVVVSVIEARAAPCYGHDCYGSSPNNFGIGEVNETELNLDKSSEHDVEVIKEGYESEIGSSVGSKSARGGNKGVNYNGRAGSYDGGDSYSTGVGYGPGGSNGENSYEGASYVGASSYGGRARRAVKRRCKTVKCQVMTNQANHYGDGDDNKNTYNVPSSQPSKGDTFGNGNHNQHTFNFKE